MMMTTYRTLVLRLIAIAAASCFVANTVAAETLFSDNFEDPHLSQWVGKGGGAHHGVVVNDPLRPGNHVRTFTELNWAGDVYGPALPVTPGQSYFVRFEYLGLLDPHSGAHAGNLGGFVGFADDTPGQHRWLAGTALIGGAEDDPLLDNGQWHTYTVRFDPFATFTPQGNAIRVMLEDFLESQGVAGDAFFDNLSLIVNPDVTGCTDLKGAPLARREVLLRQRGEPSQITTTDVAGCYAFDHLVPGKAFRVSVRGLVRSAGTHARGR